MKNFALFIIFSLPLFACRHEPNPFDGAKTDCETANRIQFANPKIGQLNRYLMYQAEGYLLEDSHQNFQYLPDTLLLEVVGEDSEGFIFREFFTAGSKPLSDWQIFVNYESDAINWHGKVEQDFFQVKTGEFYHQKSRFLFFTDPRLPLKKITENKTSIEGWKTKLKYCECDETAFAENFEQFGVYFPHLNIVKNDSWMQVDGPGTTYIFDPACTMAKILHVDWWTQKGYGFDLLP